MIELLNVCKHFEKVDAIQHLSLTFEKGITGLVGHNGAGKSTLLRLIAGVCHLDEGNIVVDGKENDSKESKQKVFFLPDDPYLPMFAKLEDAVQLYSSFYPLDQEKFYSYIKDFHLPEREKISTYSKGMKRQLFLALSFSIDASYYLLDEAFDGIDPFMLEKIKEEILKEREKGKTIIISSHNISSLEKIVDRFVILVNGKLARNGEMETLSKDFRKVQFMCKREISLEALCALSLHPLSLKKIGSLYHLVISSNELEEAKKRIHAVYSPSLLEEVSIDSEEMIRLEMLAAREEQR